ncbi:MAG: MFS transporter [Acidobacteriota bacterium]
MSTPPTTQAPSRARYKVIWFAVTLAIITYIDRVCMSQAAPTISRELQLTPVQMGYAFSAFAWAYALFEIPGGWLGDYLGPRRVLMRIVISWSVFTAATGWAWNSASLMVTRFLFGAGEAGCFPNLTKAFTTWLPTHERVRAQGFMWFSARWGGAFTPLLVVLVFKYMSWRWAFFLFGSLGIIWAVIFYRWYRDNPRDHPQVNAAELELLKGAERTASGHGNVPWMKFLKSGTVWLLWAQYFCISYGWYFYITWLPTYLQDARGLSFQKSALLAGLPLFFGGLGSLFCGLVSPPLARRTGNLGLVRRMMAFTGCAAAGVLLIWSIRLESAILAMVVMGLASFSNDLVMPGAWGACMDVGGKYAGTLSGSMNMMGNFAGGVAPIVVGYLLQSSQGNWAVTFYLAAAIYFLGAVCWLFIDPVTSLDTGAN